MATVHFFTRTSSKDKSILVPIYVRLKYGRGIDIICKTDILTKPENWSNDTGQVRQRADTFKFKAGDTEEEGRKKFAERVASLKTHIDSKIATTNRDDINAEWLRNVIADFWHPERNNTNLFGFIQAFIDKSKTKPNSRSGRPVCYKMRREYDVSFDYLKKYAEKIGKTIDFKDIDIEFYDGYIQFLQNYVKPNKKNPEVKQKLAINTVGKKIKTLKIFLNAAKEEGKNPYELYRSKKFVAMGEESEQIYLNEDELATLYNTELTDAKAVVRDLFLVGCWTGCRFGDISQITPQSIQGDMIHMKQHKTGKKVIIPLHPMVKDILSNYGGRLPQPISNQKFNEALKVIAKEAKITESTHKAMTRGGMKVSQNYKKWELVTTHTARRSFATNLYKSGFPTISIMAITGHTTEQSFLKYIKVTPDEHAKKLQIHWGEKMMKVAN